MPCFFFYAYFKMLAFILFLASLFEVHSQIATFYEENYYLNAWEMPNTIETKYFPSDSIQHFTIKTWKNSGIYYNCSIKLNQNMNCRNYFISVRSTTENIAKIYSCYTGIIEDVANVGMEIVARMPSHGELKQNNRDFEYLNCHFMQSLVRQTNAWYVLPPPVRYYQINFVKADSSEYGLNKANILKQTTCPCGAANRVRPNMRIVNGTRHEANKYPFLVHTQIEKNNGYFVAHCGGTIISSRVVLTAAHCTNKAVLNNLRYRILAGVHNLNDITADVQIRNVIQIIQHEWYKPPSFLYDISILILENELFINRTVSPVCMPPPNLDVIGEQVNSIGWGQTSPTNPMTATSFYTTLRVIDRLDCSGAYDVPYDYPTQICTFNPEQNVCNGDSGGPIVWVDPQTNRYTLVGLTSFGTLNCDLRYPTVQTEVAKFLDWINNKLREHNVMEFYCTRDDSNWF